MEVYRFTIRPNLTSVPTSRHARMNLRRGNSWMILAVYSYIRSNCNSTQTSHVSSISSQIRYLNRMEKAQEIKETYTVFEFLCIHRCLELRRYTPPILVARTRGRTSHTLRVDIDFSGRILSIGNCQCVASSSDSMKPTFQHYHGDGTSFLRGPAPPPVVRNSSVVLIMLISFFFFLLYLLLILPQGSTERTIGKDAFFW